MAEPMDTDRVRTLPHADSLHLRMAAEIDAARSVIRVLVRAAHEQGHGLRLVDIERLGDDWLLFQSMVGQALSDSEASGLGSPHDPTEDGPESGEG